MSKGSKRRPRLIDRELYESNWDMIFGNFSNNDSCGGLPAGWIPGGADVSKLKTKRERVMKNGESLKDYCLRGPISGEKR